MTTECNPQSAFHRISFAANNWNVCQYALLLMMMAQVCDMEAGELLHVVADCHIYDRHIPLIKELIQRKPYPAPVVKLNPEVRISISLQQMT